MRMRRRKLSLLLRQGQSGRLSTAGIVSPCPLVLIRSLSGMASLSLAEILARTRQREKKYREAKEVRLEKRLSKIQKNQAVIPALVDGLEDGRQEFIEGNRMEDPLSELKKSFQVWTEDEEKLFVKAFKNSPVNFFKIAKQVKCKTVTDCVQKYYIVKKNSALKRAMKYRKRRRR